MSKVTHLSDVNALLRHAGVSGLQYQDFSKTPQQLDEPIAELAPPAVEPAPPPAPPRAAVIERPAAAAPAKITSSPVAAPLNSTFDRLRRKAVARRSHLDLTLTLPARQPLRIARNDKALASKTWQEIWQLLANSASLRRPLAD